VNSAPLLEFKAFVGGSNADVRIQANRLEWSFADVERVTEMIPMTAICSVLVGKDSLTKWNMVVVVTGRTFRFRVGKATALQARAILTRLTDGVRPHHVAL
jgi:hypothetical protein